MQNFVFWIYIGLIASDLRLRSMDGDQNLLKLIEGTPDGKRKLLRTR